MPVAARCPEANAGRLARRDQSGQAERTAEVHAPCLWTGRRRDGRRTACALVARLPVEIGSGQADGAPRGTRHGRHRSARRTGRDHPTDGAHGRHRSARRTGRNHPADARRGRGTGRARRTVAPVDHPAADAPTSERQRFTRLAGGQADGARLRLSIIRRRDRRALVARLARRDRQRTGRRRTARNAPRTAARCPGAHGAQAARDRRADGTDAPQAAHGCA